MPPVSKCVCVCARHRECASGPICVHCVNAQACIHMGACVSDTFLPVKLDRLLMIVMHLLEENGSLLFSLFFHFLRRM